MSTPDSSSKIKKFGQLKECDNVNCGTILFVGDYEKHLTDCPPNPDHVTYYHIRNQCLIGSLNMRKNEEIQGLSANKLDDLVFLNVSCMQLCGLSLGDWTVLKIKNLAPLIKKVWCRNDQSVTTVQLSKGVLDLYFGEVELYPDVSVTKFTQKTEEALQIILEPIGIMKPIGISQELRSRMCNMYKGTILTIGNKISLLFFGKLLKFSIKEVLSERRDITLKSKDFFYQVSSKTRWILYENCDELDNVSEKNLMSKIGGLSNEMRKIEFLMNASLKIDNDEQRLKKTSSVLLHGNHGTGKTILANAIARKSKFNVISISAFHLYEKYPARPEETLQKIFENATLKAPSVVVLDDVDIMCPKGFSKLSDKEKRVSATLSVLLDNLHMNKNTKVFVICTTNKIDDIDPCLRRPGRLGDEIEIPVPNPAARKDILEKILCDIKHTISENQLLEISKSTHGFVGEDLMKLCSKALSHAYQNSKMILNVTDLKFCLENFKPCAMRRYQVEVPNVKWSEIGGQENLKLILKQAVEWPLKHPESFIRMGITPPKGVLMYGPPGCSKTMIAKAIATESGLNFFSIKGPELFNKWVGESERAVRELFRSARQVAPSIIFFDEIDAIGGERASGSSNSVQEKVLAQLLTELDGITPLGDVTVLAATNRPDRIDKALLRPGRMDRVVYVPLPNHETRKEIFKLKLLKMPVENLDMKILVDMTENYSGAEIDAVCNKAAMSAMSEDRERGVVTMNHFQTALEDTTPGTPEYLLQLYQKYASKRI